MVKPAAQCVASDTAALSDDETCHEVPKSRRSTAVHQKRGRVSERGEEDKNTKKKKKGATKGSRALP